MAAIITPLPPPPSTTAAPLHLQPSTTFTPPSSTIAASSPSMNTTIVSTYNTTIATNDHHHLSSHRGVCLGWSAAEGGGSVLLPYTKRVRLGCCVTATWVRLFCCLKPTKGVCSAWSAAKEGGVSVLLFTAARVLLVVVIQPQGVRLVLGLVFRSVRLDDCYSKGCCFGGITPQRVFVLVVRVRLFGLTPDLGVVGFTIDYGAFGFVTALNGVFGFGFSGNRGV
nr:hypothetical protein [Tanacetum cinerariifolium]